MTDPPEDGTDSGDATGSHGATAPQDAADEACGEFLAHDPDDRLVALAPHGGGIEPGTDDQAFAVAESLPACSAWAFVAHVDGGGTHEAYHVTSTAIDPADHRLLGRIAGGDRFDYGVAFHGYTGEGVYVGGTVERRVRERLADRIAAETGLPADAATPGDGRCDDYGGTAPSNLLNRLAAGSVQLEQSPAARDDHWRAIATAAADLLAER